MSAAASRLTGQIGHIFRNPQLLTQALTHPSVAKAAHYQRLEFLGDRVLGMAMAEKLYHAFPGEEEGSLAKRFAALVQRDALAEVARALNLGEYIHMAPGEASSGGADKPAILADVCEALIAALYLDGGYETARAFIDRHWAPLMTEGGVAPQDAKSRLQEWAQGRGLPAPAYREISREGPDHALRFTIEVSVHNNGEAQGDGSSKRAAEQAAATALLAQILNPAKGQKS